jgi:GTPase SAR1 family protein
MQCCGGNSSQTDTQATAQSKEIDKGLKGEKKTANRKIKLLLLGIGDAGKSTFAKQMKVLHKNGFSPTEFDRFKNVIHDNVITSMRQILDFAEKHDLTPKKLQDSISAVHNAADFNADLAEHVGKLWKDKNIKKVWERRNEFAIMSCADYYFNELDRIAQKEYTPTQDDILRSKMRTTGVIETIFEASDIEFSLVDVGGQRSERRKWLHVFENVTAVIFLAALDAYDMNLEEAPDVNRMTESLRVFHEITGSQWFRNTSFILFLNKSDLFAEKIKRSPLNVLFPDYEGGDDSEKGLAFIREKYKMNFGGQTLYHYETCAIDTKNIERVFNAVKDTLIAKALKETGFI